MNLDSSTLDMEFLDLTDATFEERNKALSIIRSHPPGVELPFCKNLSQPSKLATKPIECSVEQIDGHRSWADSPPSEFQLPIEESLSPLMIPIEASPQAVSQSPGHQLAPNSSAPVVCAPVYAQPPPYFAGPNVPLQTQYFPTLSNSKDSNPKMRTVNARVNDKRPKEARPPFYVPQPPQFAEQTGSIESLPQPPLPNIEALTSSGQPVPAPNYGPVAFMHPPLFQPPSFSPVYLISVPGSGGQLMYLSSGIPPQQIQRPASPILSVVEDENVKKLTFGEVPDSDDNKNENNLLEDNDKIDDEANELKVNNEVEQTSREATEIKSNIVLNNEQKCEENVNSNDQIVEKCEQKVEQLLESLEAKIETNETTNGSSSAGKTWADLFKGQEGPSSYNQQNPSFSSTSLNDTSNHNSHFSASPTNTISLNNVDTSESDAQITVIPMNKDSFAPKLAAKLRRTTLKHSMPFLVPLGFVNRGNWCYINATLQALIACPPFFNLMKELGEFHGIFRGFTSTPIIDTFAKFFTDSDYTRKSNRITIDENQKFGAREPKCIYDVLGLIKSECIKGRQEDAEEFLSSVLNGLHDEMINLFKLSEEKRTMNSNGHYTTNGHTEEIDSQVDYPDEDYDDDDNMWKEVFRHKALPTRTAKFECTPISDIFCGSIVSIRTAGKDVCGNRQSFFALQLDIQSEKIKSVEDAIRNLNASELIQGYTCPKTKQVMDASNQIFLDTLPPILIIHLKLFVYNKDGGCRKLIKKIDCPVDLDLPRECLHHHAESSSKRYKLLGVVYHDGNEAAKGHYVADVYHIGSNQWLRCDDSNIKLISNATSNKIFTGETNRTPYLLFYRRSDTLKTATKGQGQKPSFLH